jgi:hypothetical protein
MDLVEILARLIRNEVEFVLVGGFASVVQGAPVVTEDVDVCFHFTYENLERLVKAIGDLHPKHRITPQRLRFEVTEENWTMFKNLYLETDLGVLDCLGEIAGIGGFAEALVSAEEVELEFGKFRTLTIDALIRAKEAVGRPHDMATARHLKLIKAKRESGK